MNNDELRALDAQVAERVMGLHIERRDWPCYYEPECGNYEAALRDDGDPIAWDGMRDVVYRTHEPEFWPDGYAPDELGFWCKPVPHYSSDIAAAWLVVDALRARGRYVTVLCPPTGAVRVVVEWFTPERPDVVTWRRIEADTVPLAICRAAMEVSDEPKTNS